MRLNTQAKKPEPIVAVGFTSLNLFNGLGLIIIICGGTRRVFMQGTKLSPLYQCDTNNLSKLREYKGADGCEKTTWARVSTSCLSILSSSLEASDLDHISLMTLTMDLSVVKTHVHSTKYNENISVMFTVSMLYSKNSQLRGNTLSLILSRKRIRNYFK